ncbi:TonB-dependent receptor [Maribacter sp. 2210JD10-5]|uniref:TonB-dependent receptor n=1 Tax=Maribacter sp. 2210JD10-5 TaxID=3386272 RepID=UPI0039BC5250
MKKIYLAIVAIFMAATAFSQGVTTSAIGGQVTDETGEPLPGASVVAIHTPSGTTYGAATDFDGYYRISGMRTGGPYKVTISYVGFENFENANLYLELGDSRRISAKLGEKANALDEVVVTAQSGGVFDAGKTGAETNVSQRQVNTLPTISRDISDFARLTPQAKITGDNVISIAGQNNRFNSIYIDGAVNNDVFGLAASGTNGGQTGVSPISLDAIESFQINVAPFDVRQSGFAGGSINAITKSGTNTTEGSVYGFYRDQSLSGKTPVGIAGDNERTPLADFTAQTYGVRVGGAIKKDKLFYFVNYERQNNETPQPFDIGTYRGGATAADLDRLVDILDSRYGYDPGTYDNNTSSLKSDKLIAKIDWNINENNKLSLKHSYVRAVELDPNASNQGSIGFFNNGLNFESVTNSTALELNSQIGDNMANNLVIGYTTVNDNREILGDPFPAVEINDSDTNDRIFFGSEPFSTANLLEQSVLTLTNNFEIYSGAHNITIGTNNEFSSVKNVFFGRNFGYYRFDSLDDFINEERANRYRYGYSLLGGLGDDSEGAAEFDIFQFGLYIQDQVNVTDDFKFTMGVRIDIPYWADGSENEDFNSRGIALLEANGKDLRGARVGQGINATAHFSPRVGFNWDLKGDRSTQLRGGLGVFTSRLPLVWPGGAYNNNGITSGRLDIRDRSVEFNPDVTSQFADPVPGSGGLGGNVDLFEEDFKLPQTFKANIAIDQKLPAGFVFSADFLWNDNITAVAYENLNLAGPQFTTTGPGSRPNYGNEIIDDTYNLILLGYNTGAGSSYNVSGTLTKNIFSEKVDVRTSATYSYGDSDALFDATSSQNSSQWQNLESVNGSNRPDLSRSDFSPGSRIIANSTVELKWTDNVRTRIGLFYEGAAGSPFSYVVVGDGLLDDTGGFATALPFIPANEADAQFVDITDRDTGAVITSAAEQWQAFDAFIEGDDYLRTRRGKFAERNASRSDWSHIIDLKFAQEFRFNFGGNTTHRFELTADIFNFTNLLNKEWGVRTFTNFNQAQLLNFRGFEADGTTPTYTFNDRANENRNVIDDAGLNSSRWQMQVGLRYSF